MFFDIENDEMYKPQYKIFIMKCINLYKFFNYKIKLIKISQIIIKYF